MSIDDDEYMSSSGHYCSRTLGHDLALRISGEECQTKVMLDEDSLKELELPVEARHLWIASQRRRLVPLTSNYFHKTNDLCTLIALQIYMDNVEYKGLEKLRAFMMSCQTV